MFTNVSHSANPLKMSIYRSIKYGGKNRYLFVMDVDGQRFNEQTLSAAFKLHHTARRRLRMLLQPKASGMKGNQLLCDISFPETYGELKCLEGLARVAFSIWKWSGVEKMFDVKFGLKLPGVYVDACMYKKGRIIRGFCKHLGSGMYSVPYDINDNTRKVRAYMRLEEELPWPTIHEYRYLDLAGKLESYSDQYYFESKNQSMNEALLERLDAMKVRRGHAGRPDSIYAQLTPRLKKIVDMDADVAHDLKYPLVIFLYSKVGMEPEEIVDWIWKTCRWSDLDSLDKTRYQVGWTCQWAKRVMDAGGDPVSGWVYE